jgi:hypothetical protein
VSSFFHLLRRCFAPLSFTLILICISQLVSVASGSAGQNTSAKEGAAQAPEQPLPFSHKRHSQQQLPCNFCHANADPGDQMGLPDAKTCMACHQSVAAQSASIKKLAQFAKERQPVPWQRVYSIPGFVYWSHRMHLDAKLKCSACHGDVENMEVIFLFGKATTMGGCVDCHRRKDAPTGCAACHDSHLS